MDYLDIKFPGVIEDLQKSQAFVSVMTQSGNNWKWPIKKDILWYNFDEINEKIGEPVKLVNLFYAINVVFSLLMKYKVSKYLTSTNSF